MVILAILGGVALLGLNYYNGCQEAPGGDRDVTVVVPEGTTGNDVIGLLADEGMIKCELVAKWVVRQRDLSGQFVARTYTLNTNMDLDAVLSTLTTPPPPPPEMVRFIVPEGLTMAQIAEKAEEELGIDAKTFLKLAEADDKYELDPYLPASNLGLEGVLFPVGYDFRKDTKVTAKKLIAAMLDQFEEEVADLPWSNAKKLGVTPYEAIIIASLIEEETAVAEERELVSAVIYNRLADGEVLGIDASNLYADPTPEDGMLTDADLAADYPYNLRINAGLPPTPIANPGLASLEAALKPADVTYKYYVLCPQDGDGVHRFADTFDQHNANVAECLG